MVAITITPANLNVTSGTLESVTFGATILQGDVVYKDSADAKWKLAQCDGTADEAGATDFGIATTGGANNQTGLVWKTGELDPGGTAVKGIPYCIGTTPGDIVPFSDLVSTNRVTFLASGNTATDLVSMRNATGETIS